MTTKKKPVSRVKALQSSEPAPVALVVQEDTKTIERWLRQAAPYRSTRSLPDRWEALLWSWPIRLDFSMRPPNAVWPCTMTDQETWQRQEAILTRLDRLAETVYPDTWCPEPEYSEEWYPWNEPLNMHDVDFKKECRDLCDHLRALPSVAVRDPHDDLLWLCTLLEHRWGDGRLNERRETQESVISGIRKTQVRQRVCEIGEEARDAAYVAVRTNRSLDALHHTKKRAQAFKDGLQDVVKRHARFANEHLTERFVTEFHRSVKRMTKDLDFYMANTSEGRSRRATAGRQRRPWVDQARQALKDLHLSELHCSDLLIAWGLVSYPR